jgi:hypothetical protein
MFPSAYFSHEYYHAEYFPQFSATVRIVAGEIEVIPTVLDGSYVRVVPVGTGGSGNIILLPPPAREYAGSIDCKGVVLASDWQIEKSFDGDLGVTNLGIAITGIRRQRTVSAAIDVGKHVLSGSSRFRGADALIDDLYALMLLGVNQ